MVVPAALILRVSKQRVLQQVKVTFNLVKRDHVHLIRQVFVDGRHEFASVVPRRKVREVFPDKTLCVVALLLHKLLDYLASSVLEPAWNLLLVQLYDPQSIVPAVKVSFIKLQHFVA